MKWMGIFFVGYLIMLAGVVAALWHGGHPRPDRRAPGPRSAS